MKLKKLTQTFPSSDIEWRIQSGGVNTKGTWAKCLAYVTNRAIMDRLDDACGAENWKNEFKPAPNGGILCGISIKCNDEWVTKWDGAENTAVEAVKGGLSSAMKRAGVQWGIGRYLYDLDIGWANINPNGKFSSKVFDKKTKKDVYFKWDAPQLPAWALPKVMSEYLLEKYNKEIVTYSNLGDAEGVAQLWDELDKSEKILVWRKIPKEFHDNINKLLALLNGE